MNSEFTKMVPKNKAELEILLKRTQTSKNAIVMEEMGNKFNPISWEINLYTTTMSFATGLMQATIMTVQEIMKKELEKK